MSLALFILGLALGSGFWFWREAQLRKKRRRIPAHWPLSKRSLVNSRERRVWVWLSKVMFDHQVLVKTPITRFTMPTQHNKTDHWYELLNGLYCTFTVCTLEGKVLGCVDVQGRKKGSLFQERLKYSLLKQCGMCYWVVDPDEFPQLTKIRTAFLGDAAVKGDERDLLEARIKKASQNLHGSSDSQAATVASTRSETEIVLDSHFADTHLPSGWEQNSFMTPMDSRLADLN